MGSYVTPVVARAVQIYLNLYVIGCSIPNNITFRPVIHQKYFTIIYVWIKRFPLGQGHLMTPGISLVQAWISFCQGWSWIRASGSWEGIFKDSYSPIISTYWAVKGAIPPPFKAHLNPHSLYMLPTIWLKSIQQFSRWKSLWTVQMTCTASL